MSNKNDKNGGNKRSDWAEDTGIRHVKYHIKASTSTECTPPPRSIELHLLLVRPVGGSLPRQNQKSYQAVSLRGKQETRRTLRVKVFAA